VFEAAVGEHVWRHTRRGDKHVTVIVESCDITSRLVAAALLVAAQVTTGAFSASLHMVAATYLVTGTQSGAQSPPPALAESRPVSCHPRKARGQGPRGCGRNCQLDPSLDGPCVPTYTPH
jgi:hypothetical protein